MTRRKIRDAEDARTCLDRASRSGLGRAAWARAHGVDARSLNAWRLNLAWKLESKPTLRLVELVPPPRPLASYRVRCGPFEVEVDETFDDEVLGRLLSVMARC